MVESLAKLERIRPILHIVAPEHLDVNVEIASRLQSKVLDEQLKEVDLLMAASCLFVETERYLLDIDIKAELIRQEFKLVDFLLDDEIVEFLTVFLSV